MNTRKEELKKLIIKGLIGVAVGVILATSSGGKEWWGVLLFAIFFAGVPYGWQFSGKVITFGVVGSLPVMIIFYMLRLVVAMVTGWIAYPIALIRAIVRLRAPEEAEARERTGRRSFLAPHRATLPRGRNSILPPAGRRISWH